MAVPTTGQRFSRITGRVRDGDARHETVHSHRQRDSRSTDRHHTPDGAEEILWTTSRPSCSIWPSASTWWVNPWSWRVAAVSCRAGEVRPSKDSAGSRDLVTADW